MALFNKDFVPETAIEKVFRLFTEIHRDEIKVGLFMMANIFLILMAYYFIKPVREGWLSVSVIKGLTKIEVKAYSAFGQTMLLFMILPVYAKLASIWHRKKLITNVSVAFALFLVLFWFLQPGLLAEQIPYSGVGFYLFVGIFSVTLVAQFWSFAADLYGQDRGKRIFPFVAIGAASGAVAGAWIGKTLVAAHWFDTFDLILLSLIPLAAATVLAQYCESHGVSSTYHNENEDRRHLEPAATDPGGAYDLIMRHRYLWYTAIMVFLFSWVIANGDNILFAAVQDILQEKFAAQTSNEVEISELVKNATTVFYGDLYLWINFVGLFLQAFIVSRLLAFGGFGLLLLATPIISLASYIAMAVTPVIAIFKFMKIAENSSIYTINNTARNILWLPTDKAMLYQAKPTVDTLIVRLGDVMAALTVLVGIRIFQLQVLHFLIFNIVLVLGWIFVAYLVYQENKLWTNKPQV